MVGLKLARCVRAMMLMIMIAVAILALLQPKDKSPPATIIIEQFRPPVEKFVIG